MIRSHFLAGYTDDSNILTIFDKQFDEWGEAYEWLLQRVKNYHIRFSMFNIIPIMFSGE